MRSHAIPSARRRNTLRLKGYDYSQPGRYFVTLCTAGRRCCLGKIAKGKIELSDLGTVVDSAWRQIPDHFPRVKLDTFRVMPNHIHGIIIIKEYPVGVEYIQPQQERPTEGKSRFQHVAPGSLESIIRSFKAAVTREMQKGDRRKRLIWQRSFHDHVIRDDIEYYFIQRYIELNPIMWELDSDNHQTNQITRDELRDALRGCHIMDAREVERFIEIEWAYRYMSDAGQATRPQIK